MKLTRLAAACLSLMLLLPPAFGQTAAELPDNVIELRRLAESARNEGNNELLRSAIQRLHELRPNNSEYMYQLVLAHAVLGELTPAFNMMLNMQRQGLSYDFNQSPDSANLRDKQLYSYLNDLMVRAGEPIGESQELTTLDLDLGRVEAIDWDPARQAFLIGTVTDGRLLAVGEDGSAKELLRADSENELWGIHDVLVDSDRNRLWLTTSATPDFSGFDPIDRGRSAVIEFKLDALELVRRYPVPVDGLPHTLGQITQTAAGDLFFADRVPPIIYALKAGADRLTPVFAARNLVTLRGLAAAPESGRLYVADYELGIVVLDVDKNEVGILGRPETLNLGGIDGLEYFDGSLIIIQNGIQPQRIMRLELNDAGNTVENAAPVAVALETFNDPSYGTVVDQELVFFANSNSLGAADEADPIMISRVRLDESPNLVTPDMRKFIEEQMRDAEQRSEGQEPEEADEPEAEEPDPGTSEEAPGDETAGGEG